MMNDMTTTIDRLPAESSLFDDIINTDPTVDFDAARIHFDALLRAVDVGTLTLPSNERVEQHVRDAWGRYECILEAERAVDILESDNPREKITGYDLLPRYKKFLETDKFLLEHCNALQTKDSHLMMIGSGPLPLTSYIFGKSEAGFGYHVTNVDPSSGALNVGQKILEHVGVTQESICATGADVNLDESVTSVIIAALAGKDKPEKLEIIRNVASQLQLGGRISVRYGTGVRRLFYPECVLTDEECDEFGLLRVGSFAPPRDYMNAIGVYEKCA